MTSTLLTVRLFIITKPLWRSWQRVGLITLRSRVRPPPEALFIQIKALVAQLAALRSYEPMVQGSSPCRSIMFLHGFDPCTSQKYSDPGSNRAPTAC